MGKIVGITPSKISGSVGGYTYRVTKDGVVVSEKIVKKSLQRTEAQARVRMQIANLQILFSRFQGTLEKGFENLPRHMNARAAFLKANYNRFPIFLKKDEVAEGSCILVPVQVTRGSLPTITATKNGSVYQSSIALGDLTISASTTIAELSEAIINNNADFKQGDQIAYFALTQWVDGLGVNRVRVKRQRLTLDRLNTEALPATFIGGGFATVNGYLGQGAAADGFFYVHSRKTASELQVSTQFIHVESDVLYTSYGTDTAFNAAAASYGGLTPDVYLRPSDTEAEAIDDENPDSPVDPTTNVVITAQANDPAMGSVTGGGTYVQGASVTLTATANTGYKFVSWSNGRTTATITVTADADATYTATFAADSESGGGGMDG